MIHVDTVRKLLPKAQRNMITQEFLDRLEASISDPDIADSFKDNFITYLNVFSNCKKVKMEDYISAVKFVSYKLLNYSDIDAYALTFPERFKRLKDKGQEQIYAFASMYSRNKIVTQIFEQTMVPSYVLNAPLYQEAINKLVEMIRNPSTKGMVAVKACEAILQHTKPPEVVKNELSINIEQSEAITELRELTEQLAEQYRDVLNNKKMTLKEVAESPIVDTSYKVIEMRDLEDE